MITKQFLFKAFTLIVVATLLTARLPRNPAAAGAGLNTIPAPLPGDAPTATVTADPGSGYISQAIEVSGQVSAPAAQVRLAWIYGDYGQTITAAVVNTSGSSYSAQIGVPLDAQPGPAQICATVAGSAEAKFTCADFTVVEPPPGSVVGQLPAGAMQGQGIQAVNATFHLFNRAGESVASAPVGADGSFRLDTVPAGSYRAGIAGETAQTVYFNTVNVFPGTEAVASRPYNPPGSTYLDGYPCYETAAKVTMAAGSPSHLNDFAIVELDRSSWTYARNIFGPKPQPKPAGAYDFGIYISGVPLTVSFSSFLQRSSGVQVERVEYYTKTGNQAPALIGSASLQPYTVSTDIGQLPPGQVTLFAVPVVNGQALCVTRYTIQMVTDPMKNPKFQPGASTVWDANYKKYFFSGLIPNVAGLLPANYDTPSLPLFGKFENRLSAGVGVTGFLHLDGSVAVMTMDAQLYARLMSVDVVDDGVNLVPGGKNLLQWIAPDKLDQISGQIPPYSLASFRKDLTLFSGPIVAVPPWVVVRASISIGVAGELTFTGAVYPFQPAVDLQLIPSIEAWLGFGLAVDVIFGIAGAEAKIIPGIGVALPLHINPDDERLVWFADPCLSIYVRLIIEGRFLFFTFGILDEAIVNEHIPSGCNATTLLAQRQTSAGSLAAPSVLEAPSVAADPNGRMLMAYVEDPGGARPAPRIMTRFKAAGSDLWDAPQALTDGAHSVSDPVVAFAGLEHTPLVAWTENTLPSNTPPETGLDEILNHQEIYSSFWDGSAWAAPAALTDDLVGDGRAALAGDTQGATLGWTRDTDGDLSTRTDQRIAVREWTPLPGEGSGAWGDMQLLTASAAGGMNAQVSAARVYFFDPAGGQEISRRILVWTFDADGDLNTSVDRRLAVATPAAGGWSASLTSEQTRRADSPTVSISLNDPDRAALAFLIRGKDGDGLTDTGMLSNQAQLWTANYQFGDGSVTNVLPVLDENAVTARAEAPRLSSTASGETLLAFRQFGEAGSNLGLGQIALARQASGSASFSMPLALTDEPRQNWQAALAIDPVSNQAALVKISRAPILPAGIEAAPLLARLEAQSSPHFAWTGLNAQAEGDTTLDILTLSPEADPALDPQLALSQAHAAPGSSVTITATISNLGRDTSGPLNVEFYRGQPGSGALIATVPVAPLDFNARQEVAITVTAGSGGQPVYAQVVTAGENANPQNDLATGDLGRLAAPQAFGVLAGTLYEDSLAIKWQPVDLPGVAGYRVLRSTQSGGPYELVGETTQPVFNDLPVSRGQTYYYVIRTFDEAGVLSETSNEVSGELPLLRTYLPGVSR